MGYGVTMRDGSTVRRWALGDPARCGGWRVWGLVGAVACREVAVLWVDRPDGTGGARCGECGASILRELHERRERVGVAL